MKQLKNKNEVTNSLLKDIREGGESFIKMTEYDKL
jgi:hypothetical protein